MTLEIIGLTETLKESITKHIIKCYRKKRRLDVLVKHLENNDIDFREAITRMVENSNILLSKRRKENILFLDLEPDGAVNDIIVRLKERLCIE